MVSLSSMVEIRDALIATETKQKLVQSQYNVTTQSIERLMGRLTNIELAQAFIQQTAKETQEQLKFHIQDMVQNALDIVFPGAYTFVVDFKPLRGSTVVEMYLDKDGTPMDPMDSNGYGVVDVISFALRVACWSISKTDNVLILDEPFKHIRGGPRLLLGEMVQHISHRLKLQIIMVSDITDTGIIPDREFHIAMKTRISKITKVVDNAQTA